MAAKCNVRKSMNSTFFFFNYKNLLDETNLWNIRIHWRGKRLSNKNKQFLVIFAKFVFGSNLTQGLNSSISFNQKNIYVIMYTEVSNFFQIPNYD